MRSSGNEREHPCGEELRGQERWETPAVTYVEQLEVYAIACNQASTTAKASITTCPRGPIKS